MLKKPPTDDLSTGVFCIYQPGHKYPDIYPPCRDTYDLVCSVEADRLFSSSLGGFIRLIT
jgi:hypothetical protein